VRTTKDEPARRAETFLPPLLKITMTDPGSATTPTVRDSEVEAWQMLAAQYRACGLTSEHLAATTEVEGFLAFLPLTSWMRSRRRTPPTTAALVLADLFYHSLEVPAEEMGSCGIPDHLIRRLVDEGILVADGNRWRATRKFIEYRARHIVCDSVTPGARMPPDFVMPPSFSTMSLARALAAEDLGEAALHELGCGTSLLGLCFATGSLVCSDLNPRAVAFAALNARINEREAICTTADWTSALSSANGMVIFNTPTLPPLSQENWIMVNVAASEPNGLLDRYLSRLETTDVPKHVLWFCLVIPRGTTGPDDWLAPRIPAGWQWRFSEDESSPFALSDVAVKAARLPLVSWLVEDASEGPRLFEWLAAHDIGSVQSGVLRLDKR
jgi:hypothetical protein